MTFQKTDENLPETLYFSYEGKDYILKGTEGSADSVIDYIEKMTE